MSRTILVIRAAIITPSEATEQTSAIRNRLEGKYHLGSGTVGRMFSKSAMCQSPVCVLMRRRENADCPFLEILEFFDRMSVAGIDRPITGLPIQYIDILQRRLEQNVRPGMRHPGERIATHRSGPE